jgi:hypothetical protein
MVRPVADRLAAARPRPPALEAQAQHLMLPHLLFGSKTVEMSRA